MSDTTLPDYGEYRVLRDYEAPEVLKYELGMDWMSPRMTVNLERMDAAALVGYGVLELVREIDE